MGLLDPSTVIVMAAIMCGAMSIVLYSAHRSFPDEIKGLGHWAGGLLLLKYIVPMRFKCFTPYFTGMISRSG